MLSTAVRELEALGFRSVLLWVLEENVGARRFYERCGFALQDAYKTETFGGRELREVLYRRSIPGQPV